MHMSRILLTLQNRLLLGFDWTFIIEQIKVLIWVLILVSLIS